MFIVKPIVGLIIWLISAILVILVYTCFRTRILYSGSVVKVRPCWGCLTKSNFNII
ncbi:hypothetical protein LINPERPRIM_LOCUS15672 [Linum perenne]